MSMESICATTTIFFVIVNLLKLLCPLIIVSIVYIHEPFMFNQ